jgi:hypothetical protein
MPSWRNQKERGQGVATTTANREVGAQLEVEVTAATTLEFQVAVARLPGLDIRESLSITLNGNPIEAREIIGPHETRIHSLEVEQGTVQLSYSATVAGEAQSAPVSDIDVISYLRPSRYAEADKFFGVAATFWRRSPRGSVRGWITYPDRVIRSTALPTRCWPVQGYAATTHIW